MSDIRKIGMWLAVFFVALVMMLLWSIHQSDVATGGIGTKHPRICFNATTWDAKDTDRPCVAIRLYEDNTFNYTVREADGDPWVSR